MKNKIGLAIFLSVGAAFANDLCVDGVGSGCGQWWMTSSLDADGSYNHSTGVTTAYTANNTNVTASQDPLNAIFSWTSQQQNVTTNNSTSVWSNLGSSSTPVTTNNAASGLFISASDYSGYNSVSSLVPSNVGGSAPIIGGSSSTSSYEAYLAAIYGITYGTPSTPSTPGNVVVTPNADPIPEPASVLSMGLGVAMLAVLARRRAARK